MVGKSTHRVPHEHSRSSNPVAAGASNEFLRPAHLGDVQICEGVEQLLQGRHGIFDMTVSNQRGETVAMFRGKSAQIKGSVLPEGEAG